MAENTLIPKAATWLDQSFNVMLIGLHGVGKTQVVLDECREKDLKLKYFSCSTLDPFVDLVGVPFARAADESNDQEYLKMVRQRNIDDAEIIFMDEFNRADPKVHNACMEIIQFHTINGEPLPNLRMVWAAMNPPGKDYDVEELDPALIDRFDVFEDVAARPSPEYLSTRGIRLPVAQALCAWWNEQNKNRRKVSEMITPRRLEKIGKVYEATGEFKCAIPLWFNTDYGKLRQMLQEAEAKSEAQGISGGDAQTGPSRRFQYNSKSLQDNEFEVSEYLAKNQGDLETATAVTSALNSRHGSRLARDYGAILNNLAPSVLEAFVTGLSNKKLLSLHEECQEYNTTTDKGLAATMFARTDTLRKVVGLEASERGLV